MIDRRFFIGFLILNLIFACLYVSISHKLILASEILFHILTDCLKNEFSIVFFIPFYTRDDFRSRELPLKT